MFPLEQQTIFLTLAGSEGVDALLGDVLRLP
jgi:hypothetical protein